MGSGTVHAAVAPEASVGPGKLAAGHGMGEEGEGRGSFTAASGRAVGKEREKGYSSHHFGSGTRIKSALSQAILSLDMPETWV